MEVMKHEGGYHEGYEVTYSLEISCPNSFYDWEDKDAEVCKFRTLELKNVNVTVG